MNKNWKLKIKNFQQGITLVEVIVVIFLVVLITAIAIFNFQKIQQRLALSRSAYKIAQDLRRVQDLAMSGSGLKDASGNEIHKAGYGIYFVTGDDIVIDGETVASKKKYLIYADSCQVGDDTALDRYAHYYSKYTSTVDESYCRHGSSYEMESINVDPENKGVYVKNTILWTSINFRPPNPITNIYVNSITGSQSSAEIVLGIESDSSLTRTIYVNTSGLIEVE